MKYKKHYHAVYYGDHHIVISTRYRRKIINEGIFAYLGLKLKDITEHYPYIEFKEFNHDEDHVHMLVSIPPSITPGKVVGLFKQNTSKGIKQKFPFLKKVYWGTDSIWSDGYFSSTVGIAEAVIRKYIENQGFEDEGQTAKLFE